MKAIGTVIFILFTLVSQIMAQTRADSAWTHPQTLYPEREYRLKTVPALPIAVKLSNLHWPISQGESSTCVAHAICNAKTWQEAQASGWIFAAHSAAENLTHMFSPSFIYNQIHIHGGGGGIATDDGLIFMAQHGVATLDQFGFDEHDDSTQPSMAVRYQAMNNRQQDDWAFTWSDQIAKWLLSCGIPVITALKNPSGSYHCVCLFGYNDTIMIDGQLGAWYYMNSVGPEWGENGCSWLPYSAPPATKVFYWSSDRPNQLPEQVFKFQFNLGTKNYSPPRQETFFHFLMNGDTIKTIKVRPVTNEYLLALDTAIKANEIVLRSIYKIDQVNKKNFPFTNEFYSAQAYNISDNSLRPLIWDSLTVRKIDSVVLAPNKTRYYLSSTLETTIQLATLGEEEVIPENFQFSAAPNPFPTQTTFRFSLDQEAVVSLEVLDMRGRVVAQPLTDERLLSGPQIINFSTDLPAGLYIARLILNHQQVKNLRIIVVR